MESFLKYLQTSSARRNGALHYDRYQWTVLWTVHCDLLITLNDYARDYV